jgi:sterol desaturase/sphingolipid hydroxylase (fatty acid hydroxylase superfamily)
VYWLQHEGNLKWALLVGAFTICALWETFRPRRELTVPTGRRWTRHAILAFALNSPLAWLLRLNALAVSIAVANSGYGVLNRPLFPWWARCVLSVLILDLFKYAQHRLYHAIPALWRVHRVHHADPDFDWSTSLLFHPGELLLTEGSYLALIALLAPPPLAVLGVELSVIAQNIFVHANVMLPARVEHALRRFLITPDMHRIHHSDEFAEQNANYGTVFPWWDRLFSTYVAEPAQGHEKMGIGLRGVPGLGVLGLLGLPFRGAGTLACRAETSERPASGHLGASASVREDAPG